MTTVKKNPARKPRQAASDMEKIIDVEPISKPGSPQVEVHEISTKVQRAEDSQAEALRDIITRDIADGRMGEPGSYLDTRPMTWKKYTACFCAIASAVARTAHCARTMNWWTVGAKACTPTKTA